jgi:hypothetical protein
VAGHSSRGADPLTPLSHPYWPQAPGFTLFWCLARRSLLTIWAAGALAGCLVAEPPPHPNPEQTPPVIDLNRTFPLVTQITLLRQGERQTFSAAVRSEDQGEKLIGLLFLDYSLRNPERFLQFGEARPSTFDDTSRRLGISWQVPPSERDCHQVTMLITHAGNLDYQTGIPQPILDSDVALATWWVNIIDPNATNAGDPYDLENCPTRVEPP